MKASARRRDVGSPPSGVLLTNGRDPGCISISLNRTYTALVVDRLGAADLATRRTPNESERIVANVQTTDIAAAARFYRDVLGLEVLMDMGWIATYGSGNKTTPQISFAFEGGAGTPTPDLSIEVDDVDAALSRAEDTGFAIEYGPVDESWSVRRFYTRDPFGKLVNILEHKDRQRHR